MKRSFYALFVLLSTLFGPLILAPAANSAHSAAAKTTETVPSEDDPSATPRTEQEPSQPLCLFPLERGESPEVLVVLPEDFDYELHSEIASEGEYCEIEQHASSSPVQNDAIAQSHPAPEAWWPKENSEMLEGLCLPSSELAEGADEPWIGPPVAGAEPVAPEAADFVEDAPSPELVECAAAADHYFALREREREIASVHFGRWALNRYEEAIYDLSMAIQANGLKLATSVTDLNARARNLIWRQFEGDAARFGELARDSVGELLSAAPIAAEVVSSKWFVEKETALPSPPFCECWALQEAEFDLEEPADASPNVSGLGEIAACELSSESIGPERLEGPITGPPAPSSEESVSEAAPDEVPLTALTEAELTGFDPNAAEYSAVELFEAENLAALEAGMIYGNPAIPATPTEDLRCEDASDSAPLVAESEPAFDLEPWKAGLAKAVEQVLDRAATLQRWAAEYELAPAAEPAHDAEWEHYHYYE